MTGAVPEPGRLHSTVSVVIPCFRCAATIDRAVASVAAQSMLPAELILVDDASGDDTLPALHRLRDQYQAGWIKVIPQDRNCGAGETRNTGWDAAQSEYVAFLDADDTWYPRKLEIQLHAMSAHPDAVMSGHGAVIDKAISDPAVTKSIPVETITFQQLLLANRFITPSVLLKRDLPFRFRSGQRHMEDHLLWMQIAASGAIILRLDTKLAVTFKPAYGAAGLSSNLWLMEKAECANYLQLAEDGAITYLSAYALCVYSALKFFRRIAIVAVRG